MQLILFFLNGVEIILGHFFPLTINFTKSFFFKKKSLKFTPKMREKFF